MLFFYNNQWWLSSNKAYTNVRELEKRKVKLHSQLFSWEGIYFSAYGALRVNCYILDSPTDK